MTARSHSELSDALADMLGQLGWVSRNDAQWENLHKALPEIASLLAASQRVGAIALGAAGTHAERVLELEAEVLTLRESLAEVNRLLSLHVAEVARLASEPEAKP